jgi:arylsulfatase A-like enzyme
MSGRFPRSTGIVFNAAGVLDPLAPLIGGGGPPASPFRFRGSTLTDWLRVADPRSRALSVSRKDRGAILPIGRQPQEVYWYALDGRFTTSTYYHDTLPSWVTRFNDRDLPKKLAGTAWTLLLPASAYPEPDSVPVESGGRGFMFPHPIPANRADAARLMGEFPFMDELTLQMAMSGLEALGLGKGPQTDVVAISLSSTDAVGHRFGPDSREMHDQILRLDRYLGAFFDALYKLRDSTRIVVALTADHGMAPYPELHAQATGTIAHYADIWPLVQATEQKLAVLHLDSTALHFEEGMLYVDRPKLQRAGVNTDSLLQQFAESARRIQGIGRVDLVKSLASRDTVTDAVARRWLHMIPPDLPVELVVSLEPYAYWEGTPVATHGSPNDYDTHVPLLFYGPMIKAGRYADFSRVVDMAPTLAWIVGVKPLEPLDGHVLTQALRFPTSAR